MVQRNARRQQCERLHGEGCLARGRDNGPAAVRSEGNWPSIGKRWPVGARREALGTPTALAVAAAQVAGQARTSAGLGSDHM